ncbi:hypothetical protein AQ490_14645 [Wenjunlia vitaminophila]|uniref:TIGR02611 family protein n=1 Tax=Wenjunlia vitaminophila TaxID=76728 RepID=A0A0T6LWG4_WENVI|nr:TIGR02611 family protein [Wenjunlia vitaminophila]KRV50337.1 hypothetical protein AQ490_14645 [Wenjunlia vitaminophila]
MTTGSDGLHGKPEDDSEGASPDTGAEGRVYKDSGVQVAAQVAEDKVAGADGKPEFGSRAPMFVKRYRPLHLTWQIGVFLVGVAIIVAGIAMLVLPGPGWVAIFLGLAVLGTEFVWAQRVLRWSKQQAARAASRAMDPRTRRRNLVFLIVGLLLAGGGVAIYLSQYGPHLP